MESKKRDLKKVRPGLKPVRGEHVSKRFSNAMNRTPNNVQASRAWSKWGSFSLSLCLFDLFKSKWWWRWFILQPFLEQATTNRWTIETNSLPFDAGISASFSTISTEFSAISSFGTCCSGAQFAARALNSAIGGQNVFRIKGCSTYLAAFSWAIFPWITAPNVQGRWLSLHQAKK